MQPPGFRACALRLLMVPSYTGHLGGHQVWCEGVHIGGMSCLPSVAELAAAQLHQSPHQSPQLLVHCISQFPGRWMTLSSQVLVVLGWSLVCAFKTPTPWGSCRMGTRPAPQRHDNAPICLNPGRARSMPR